MSKKTAKIILSNIKDSDGWSELAKDVAFEKFKKNNPDLDKDKLHEKFYFTVISKMFEYGEFGNIEIEVDEDFNIVSGKIIPFKKE